MSTVTLLICQVEKTATLMEQTKQKVTVASGQADAVINGAKAFTEGAEQQVAALRKGKGMVADATSLAEAAFAAFRYHRQLVWLIGSCNFVCVICPCWMKSCIPPHIGTPHFDKTRSMGCCTRLDCYIPNDLLLAFIPFVKSVGEPLENSRPVGWHVM